MNQLLEMEFVDDGCLKVIYYLQDGLSFIINDKKVFRLMQTHQLLYWSKQIKIGIKQWVTKLVAEPTVAFSYWEFDIRFMYIPGTGKMILLLTVTDVYSRWLLGHLLQESIKKEDVKLFFILITETYMHPDKVHVRCDNGSQFKSTLVRDYLLSAGMEQEFTKPATPEQNAHIESYYSLLERVVCNCYEFKTKDCFNTLNRWRRFCNYERIYFATDYKSPHKNLINQGIDVDQLFRQVNERQKIVLWG